MSADEASSILGIDTPAIPGSASTCNYGRIQGPGIELLLRRDSGSSLTDTPASGATGVTVRGVRAAYQPQIGSSRPSPGGPTVSYTPSTLTFVRGAYVVVLVGKYLPDPKRQLEQAMGLVVARLGPNAR